jgi:hypothetical protein
MGLGVGGPAQAAGITLMTPAGLRTGDHFRFVFITDEGRDATSSSIEDYDSFVQSQAEGATYDSAVVNWLAIGSTPTVDAIDHVGRTPDPVYLADGTLVTTSTTTTGLWSGALQHAINEDLAGIGRFLRVWTGTLGDGENAQTYALGSTSFFPGLSLQGRSQQFERVKLCTYDERVISSLWPHA